MGKRLVVLVALIAVFMVGPASRLTFGQAKTTLVIGHTTEGLTLDPAGTADRETRIVTHQLFDFLLTSTERGVEPGLATKWEVSPDGRVWTFTLRDDVKFHDGTPFNAAAVKYNFDRAVQLGPKAPVLLPIEAIYVRAEVVSPTQVRVVLKQRWAGFLNSVGGEFFGIVSPTAAERLGDDFGRAPVGSGPFIFKSWVRNEAMIIGRNPAYRWGPNFLGNTGPPRIDEVVYRLIPEPATLTAAFQRGEAQLLDFVAATDVARLRQAGFASDIEVQITPGVPSTYHFNTQREPTNDVRVRQAVAYAINKGALQQSPAYGQGLIRPVYSYLTRTNWAHNAELEASRPYAYDAQRARRLLEEAGWRAGADGLRSKDGRPLMLEMLSFAPFPISTTTDLIVQGQLREVGIGTEIRRVDLAALFAGMRAGQFHMVLTAVSGFDPESSLRRAFYSTGGANWSRYRDPEVDRLIERGGEELNVAQRRAIYRQTQDAIFKDLPALPIVPFTGIVMKHKNVTGIWFDPRSGFKLVNADIR
jgi:peptide/nickel transport system substrate-binding protein